METVTFINIDESGNKTEVTRVYDGIDLGIWEITEAFAEFLRGCGYAEENIQSILNLD